ncbi:MAG TPA: lysophospholipid acyltransferase family protein [Bacteroidia bacterium]
MQLIGFYIILPFLYLISLLPFWLLYLLSDFFYVLLFYVVGYRKKVVLQNLKNSFPEKSERELLLLRKKFYHYFCDLFLETFKTLTISKDEMLKHCTMRSDSIALMNQLYEEKKNAILVMGHLGNWEWGGNTFSLLCKQQLYVIYHPLANRHYNQLIIGMRTRFGTKLIEMKNTFRDMLKNKSEVNATAFIADQTPPPENAYWTNFMHQDTPVFKGTELIAKKLQLPIVFINVQLVQRGYYEITAEMLCERPGNLPEGKVSEMHTRKLEEEIRKNPATWLWSHRRWKHERPVAQF